MSGTFETLDMAAYARRAHFDYFRQMGYPYVGVTVDADVTRLRRRARQTGESFFLLLLYAAGRAANRVEQLRERIAGDGIVRYARCPTSHTVMKPDGTYAYCEADPFLPWADFAQRTAARQEAAKHAGGLEEESDVQSLIFISCLPWVRYTALIQPVPFPADSNPRITWGQYREEGGRVLVPVSLLAHHALVDGKHLGDFYQALAQEISAL